jgi:hypothetical protein
MPGLGYRCNLQVGNAMLIAIFTRRIGGFVFGSIRHGDRRPIQNANSATMPASGLRRFAFDLLAVSHTNARKDSSGKLLRAVQYAPVLAEHDERFCDHRQAMSRASATAA